MSVALVTGSAGLIGAATVRRFSSEGMDVVGIDNDMRSHFFGSEASTAWNRRRLEAECQGYVHMDADIRDLDALGQIFKRYGSDISVIVHAAAQPSHDWAAKDPHTDFTVNANGTLNMLEAARQYCAEAPFIFTSTNKVYGDRPNQLPLIEMPTRWELDSQHPYSQDGIDETMSIDGTLHSVFGASKVAADVMVQEYGRYFGMPTATFRGGCLTGPGHAGAQLHGFLAYLVKCAVTNTPYTVIGHKGKQVRDNIHARDLVDAFWHFFQKPRMGEVYNIGGGRELNCSMQEAIECCEGLTGRSMNWKYTDEARIGDHIWWISDTGKFREHYPDWGLTYNFKGLMAEIHDELVERGALNKGG